MVLEDHNIRNGKGKKCNSCVCLCARVGGGGGVGGVCGTDADL